jgi:hypothetical protein
MALRAVGLLCALAALTAVAPAARAQAGPQLGPGALNRFYDAANDRHWVTPGDVGAGYAHEATLGYLLPGGGPGRQAIYGCRAGGADQFLSHDPGCEGQVQLGRYGYAYASPPDGIETVAVWRCARPGGHFASRDAGCEGRRTEARLGFLLTRGTALVRTNLSGLHWVTSAAVPAGGTYEATLGYLLETGGAGRVALYSCRAGGDQFLSRDPGCEGREPLGREGFLYEAAPAAEESVPLYRCLAGDHFASSDPGCEGRRTEGLLGYLRARQPALQQYGNARTGTRWVTTGAPGANYLYERTLGFLLPSGGANMQAIYGCRAGAHDHFLSLDAGCEGRAGEGRVGFAFAVAPASEETVALYRCRGAGNHFASLDPGCEGHVTEARLGYVRTVEHGPPPPPACGPSGATVEFSVRGKRARTVRYGRAVRLTGRALRPGGAPATGAEILILQGAGTDLAEAGRAVAGADGTFTFRLPAGTSRTLRAAFRSEPADPALACSATARVAVRAKAKLRARLRGRVVRFRGRVRGPVPAKGKLLDVQAYDGGRWRKFGTARTRRDGTFRTRYRFTRSARSKTYRFRVRVPRETGFPYARGYSNVAKIRLRSRGGA